MKRTASALKIALALPFPTVAEVRFVNLTETNPYECVREMYHTVVPNHPQV